MTCKICANKENNNSFQVKEMMFGTREVFSYFICNHCNCLQLEDPSIDFSNYYPSNEYYSYQNVDEKRYKGWKGWNRLQGIKNSSSNGFLSMLGRIVSKSKQYDIFREIGIKKHHSIIDVGCGNGNFLFPLSLIGYKKLKGIDPFRQNVTEYKNGLVVEPIKLKNEKNNWDVFFYNHSFEHIVNPLDELVQIKKRLNKHGYCILAIPTFPNEAWERHHVNWYQIDAPRHVFLHSEKSISLIAEKAGLKLTDSIYNSRSGQFLISEQYAQNISANEIRKPSGLKKIAYKARKIKLEMLSKQLNKQKRGDQAYFILEHQ